MTDKQAKAQSDAARIVTAAAAWAAIATSEGRPEEAAPWATILLAARRLETGKLTGDAQ